MRREGEVSLAISLQQRPFPFLFQKTTSTFPFSFPLDLGSATSPCSSLGQLFPKKNAESFAFPTPLKRASLPEAKKVPPFPLPLLVKSSSGASLSFRQPPYLWTPFPPFTEGRLFFLFFLPKILAIQSPSSFTVRGIRLLERKRQFPFFFPFPFLTPSSPPRMTVFFFSKRKKISPPSLLPQ